MNVDKDKLDIVVELYMHKLNIDMVGITLQERQELLLELKLDFAEKWKRVKDYYMAQIKKIRREKALKIKELYKKQMTELIKTGKTESEIEKTLKTKYSAEMLELKSHYHKLENKIIAAMNTAKKVLEKTYEKSAAKIQSSMLKPGVKDVNWKNLSKLGKTGVVGGAIGTAGYIAYKHGE